jgi:hypothetical protein
MILLAFVMSLVDKRLGGRKSDPARSAMTRLKYATILAAIAMFVLLMRLPSGIHRAPSAAVEQLQRDLSDDLSRLRETVSMGFAVAACWFSAAYGALKAMASRAAAK